MEPPCCLCVYPPIIAGQRLCRHEYTSRNRKIVGRVVFYVVRAVCDYLLTLERAKIWS